MTERSQREIPPPPEEPAPDECCGSGCDPCVFDLYEERLERWRRRYAASRDDNQDSGGR